MSVLETETRDGVTILAMNRPERRNALSSELVDALHAGLEDADADAATRVIVVTGRGKVFCAGGDLAGGMSHDGGVLAAERARGRYGTLLSLIPRLRKPVVAAVQGDALGGGLGLVAACDLAVADAEARLGTPEVRLGLFPMVITAALQRNVPRKALLELMLTGAKVDAERARELGLVNRVTPEGECLEGALALAGEMASKSMAALGMGKEAFYAVADMPYEAALHHLNGRLTMNLLTEDAMEGIGAFVQRRAPEWKDR